MPKKNRSCDPAVKRLCKNHSRCSKTRHCQLKYKGESILQYAKATLGTDKTEGILVGKSYLVCHDMGKALDNFFSAHELTDSPVGKKPSSSSSTGAKKVFSPTPKKSPTKRKLGPQGLQNMQIEDSEEENTAAPNSSEKKIKYIKGHMKKSGVMM